MLKLSYILKVTFNSLFETGLLISIANLLLIEICISSVSISSSLI